MWTIWEDKVDFRIIRRGLEPCKELELDPSDIQHLRSLRLTGKLIIIEFLDGSGNSYLYQLRPHSKFAQKLEKSARKYPLEPPIRVGGAIPKGNRFDFLLQKCTELGVTDFHFIVWERAIREEYSKIRTEKIIKEAVVQSGRGYLPNIQTHKNWKEILEWYPPDSIIVLHPYAKEILKMEETKNSILLIGPEGGLEKEIEELERAKCKLRNAGKNILRVETAYTYAASIARQAHLEFQ